MAGRVVIIVMDGLGIGELPDACLYNDTGSHTLDNIAKTLSAFNIDILSSLGIGLIQGVNHIKKTQNPVGSFGRMMERGAGKDTTTGHWEMMGVILKEPFRVFPQGFPKEIMEKFKTASGYDYLWGMPASGTEIIERLGAEHIKSGRPIVYTSADSVFQIAGHEDIIKVEELYKISAITRKFLDEYNIARVIARPFTGKVGSFKRTERRKDFSMPPPQDTVLDIIKKRGISVVGVGKIGDIFAHRGFTEELHAVNNMEVLDKVGAALKNVKQGLIFANLIDFDMLYGHRNDVQGYATALKEADKRIPEVMELLKHDDMLIITADHGCDPTTPSTDHSREYAPLLVYGKTLKSGVNLKTRETFADIGQTVVEYFGCGAIKNGSSFLGLVRR